MRAVPELPRVDRGRNQGRVDGGLVRRHAEGSPDVGIWASRRQNGRWTSPVEVANGVKPDGCAGRATIRSFSNARAARLRFITRSAAIPGLAGYRKTSIDGGRTWSTAELLPEPLIGPVKNKPVLLADGTLLSGSSTEHDGWRVHFERSTDGGKSWQFIGPVNDGRQIAAIQPSIFSIQAAGCKRSAALAREGSSRSGRKTAARAGAKWH